MKIIIFMMTSSTGNIFRVIGPLYGEFTGPREVLPGEFPAKRPVTRSFDVFFDLRILQNHWTEIVQTSLRFCVEFNVNLCL